MLVLLEGNADASTRGADGQIFSKRNRNAQANARANTACDGEGSEVVRSFHESFCFGAFGFHAARASAAITAPCCADLLAMACNIEFRSDEERA